MNYREILLTVSLLLTSSTVYGNVVIIDGKPFKANFEEVELKSCPQDRPAGPAWLATFASANIAFDNAIAFNLASCIANCSSDADCEVRCESDPEAVRLRRQHAMLRVFEAFRPYPSRFRSAHCAEVRDDICKRKCVSEDVFTVDECLVGCNQYEPYNR